MIFNRLHKDQRGSAMTEFVIGLPIFVLIFSGMGALYKINDHSLRINGTANTKLWVDAQDSLIGKSSVSPLGALLTIDSFSDLLTTGTQVGGIYKDSYAKVGFASLLIPGAPETDSLAYNIQGVHEKFRDKSPSKFLLNDGVRPSLSFDGFGGFLNSLIDATGSSLGLGAGIRYGANLIPKGGDDVVTTSFGDYAFNSPKLAVPFNTAATHRLAPLALIRLQHTQDEVTDKSILNFNGWSDVNWDGPPDWGGQGSSPTPPSYCGAQHQAYGQCRVELSKCQRKKNPYKRWRCKRKWKKRCKRRKPSNECTPAVTQPPQPTPAECAAFGLPPGCGTEIKEP